MKYEFKFTLNKNDLFFSSLYYAYLSKAGVFDLVFTLFSIFVIIFTNITGVFNTFTIAYKLTLIICPFIFTIIQPVMLYIKVVNRLKRMPQSEMHIVFHDDIIKASSNDQNVGFEYNNITRIKKYSNMIILFYNSIYGQILPIRAFDSNEQYDEFYNFLLYKINK